MISGGFIFGDGCRPRVSATGVGNSGVGFSAVSRGNLEPAAEARMADSRKAEAPVAGTRHLKGISYVCTFAQAAGRFALLHLGQHVVLSLPAASDHTIPA